MADSPGAIVIYGAWYFGRVVEEAAIAAGWDVLGFVDPEPPADVTTLQTVPPGVPAIVAIGDNRTRAEVSAALAEQGRPLATVVHPEAYVSPSASLGAGSYVAEFAVVRTGAVVAGGVVLQAGCVVSHDCRLQAHASFGPNAVAASKVRIGLRTVVGAGAAIAPGLVIGQDSTVAAGAAVFKDAGDNVSLVGNPARVTPSPDKAVIHSDWGANLAW